MILLRGDTGLETVYSSTPHVQFVRLDIPTPPAARRQVEIPSASAVQILPLTLAELPAEWRLTAQRAFHSATR
ncbi:MAG: hypothetical protein V4719_27255 [Planctomycetota bacterium]